MLITPPPLRITNQSQSAPLPTANPGVEVVVLIAGLYNGPDHKSLGNQDQGAIITIASGGYSSYLIEHGFVRPLIQRDGDDDPLAALLLKALDETISPYTEKPDTVKSNTVKPDMVEPDTANPDTVEADTVDPFALPDSCLPYPEATEPALCADPDRPWLFWCALGLTEGVAKNLWDAGFISASRTLELGESSLLSVSGIGQVRAKQVLAWASTHHD